MKRKLNPRPWHQAEQTHRRRKALGRALHQVRSSRWRFMMARAKWFVDPASNRAGKLPQLHIPRLVRKHRQAITLAAMASGY